MMNDKLFKGAWSDFYVLFSTPIVQTVRFQILIDIAPVALSRCRSIIGTSDVVMIPTRFGKLISPFFVHNI